MVAKRVCTVITNSQEIGCNEIKPSEKGNRIRIYISPREVVVTGHLISDKQPL